MHKTLLTLLKASILIALLSGCGGESGDGGSSSSSSNTKLVSKQLSVVNKIPAEYARSIEVDTRKKLLYLGDNSELKVINTDKNNTIIERLSQSGSDLLDLALSRDKSLLYAVDYDYFLIYDVSDTDNITLKDSIASRGARQLYVSSDESVAVVQDLDGVKVLDISNKSNIKVAFEFSDSEYHIRSIALAKSKKELFTIEGSSTNSESGVFNVYDLNNPAHPNKIHSESGFPSISLMVSHDEKRLFLASHGIVQIADITDIDNIKSLYVYGSKERATADTFIALSSDDKTFVTSYGSNLFIYDIHDLKNVQVTKANNNFWDLGRVKIVDDLLYVPDGSNGLWILKK